MDSQEWLEWQEGMPAMETRLTAELARARDHHDRAKVEFDLATARARELGPDTRDGNYTILKATRAYNHTLREYRHALDRFCDFILRGKIPPDRESGRRRPASQKTKRAS